MKKDTKEVAVAPTNEIAGWNREQIELIKNTVARGATDLELQLFLHIAKKAGLDPLTKQIHFIKRKVWNRNLNNGKGGYEDVGTTQTGIDGYRVVAGRNNLAGIDDAIYDSEDGIHPKKASVSVYKLVGGMRVPFTATARWAEYAATDRDGNPQAMWKKMPYLMLAKVAEALALRKAFPNDLSGIYTNEEMAQADAPVIYPAEYDQTPIKANAKVISTGDDLEGEPVVQLEEKHVPDNPVADFLDKKRRVKELVDSIVLHPLEQTKEAYDNWVWQNTDLLLTPKNYDAIIVELTKTKAGEK